ncbi:penicillin-binding transpeptidase domain-containing protein [Clostridium sp. DL1XJH146]
MFEDKYIIKRRIKRLFVIALLLLSFLALRLYFIMNKSSEELGAIADAQITIKEVKGTLNYNLLDCNGKDLLKYKEKFYFCVYSNLFSKNIYNTKLDDLIAMNIILKKYNKDYNLMNIDVDSYEKLTWEIDEKTYNELREIKGVKGVYTFSCKDIDSENRESSIENIITNPIYYKRISDNSEIKYVETEKPEGSLEDEIIKKTSNNDYVNDIFKIDESGAVENISSEIPKENLDVVLTIDKEIQLKIEEVLNSEKYKDDEQIGVVVMESDTGKIRGLAQKDYFIDANIVLGTGTESFCPGSIFKILVEEAGLEKEVVDLNKVYIHEENGITDHFEWDSMKIDEGFIRSCNNLFSQVGEELTVDVMNSYAEKQGLYEKVVNIAQEKEGVCDNDTDAWGLTSIGKKSQITPIEAISIPNTIINGGVYVKPTIIEGYADNSSNIIEQKEKEEERIISEKNANIIKNQMIDVVRDEDGTGRKAYSSYINLGGKTGTAGRKEEGEFISDKDDYDDIECNDLWFAGFFEIDNKNYSMIVFVPDKEVGVYASEICAPIFKDIAENLYSYLQ